MKTYITYRKNKNKINSRLLFRNIANQMVTELKSLKHNYGGNGRRDFTPATIFFKANGETTKTVNLRDFILQAWTSTTVKVSPSSWQKENDTKCKWGFQSTGSAKCERKYKTCFHYLNFPKVIRCLMQNDVSIDLKRLIEKTEGIQSMYSEYIRIKLEKQQKQNHREISVKGPGIWKLNSTLLKISWGQPRVILKFLKLNKSENTVLMNL